MMRDVDPTPKVIVTGGAQGVGAAIVGLLARQGSTVAVFDRAAVETAALSQSLGNQGWRVQAEVVDVSDPQEVAEAVARLQRQWGTVDVLVNNAGIEDPIDRSTSEISYDSWQRIIATNLTGPFLLMKQVLPLMVRQGRGCIVNVASVKALLPLPGSAAYNAAKTGLIALTRSAALEYASDSIRINAVCPGAVEGTVMTQSYLAHTTHPEPQRALNALHAMNRVASPNEIAAVVAFLVSSAASFVTGAIVPVDGGFSAGISPHLLGSVG